MLTGADASAPLPVCCAPEADPDPVAVVAAPEPVAALEPVAVALPEAAEELAGATEARLATDAHLAAELAEESPWV